MGKLRDKMIQDLELGCLSPKTRKEYLRCARWFVVYDRRPPEELGKTKFATFCCTSQPSGRWGPRRAGYLAAIRFLYRVTLRRPEVVSGIPWPRVDSALPYILSGTEVQALLDAIPSMKHRAILMTTYGLGLCISEVCTLGVGDIDSKRMLVHIRGPECGRDRSCRCPSGCCLRCAATGWRSGLRGSSCSPANGWERGVGRRRSVATCGRQRRRRSSRSV